MTTRQQLVDRITKATCDALSRHGLASDRTSSNRKFVEAISDGLGDILDPLLAAVQVLGDQVAEHNKVLLTSEPTQAQQLNEAETPKAWACYCGWTNAGDITNCRVCTGGSPLARALRSQREAFIAHTHTVSVDLGNERTPAKAVDGWTSAFTGVGVSPRTTVLLRVDRPVKAYDLLCFNQDGVLRPRHSGEREQCIAKADAEPEFVEGLSYGHWLVVVEAV